ncbi:hypothetical protein [Bradyrhizobium sp. HKCCYLS20291]|uniref:hypothetical protein n=1 Tax=Bradyrhizobium sp. HKCCYLS20291 TaxID=3420766 RepID=UPI003EBACDF5
MLLWLIQTCHDAYRQQIGLQLSMSKYAEQIAASLADEPLRSTIGRSPAARMGGTDWPKRSIAKPTEGEWEFVVRTGVYVPIGMRRRRTDGTWEFRDVTEQDVRDYIESEAF